MPTASSNSRDRLLAYKLDRAVRGAKAGAGIGMLLGSLVYFLLSSSLPESSFVPFVIATCTVLAVLGGLFFPLDLPYHDWEDDPDNLTPADRVRRLHSKQRPHH